MGGEVLRRAAPLALAAVLRRAARLALAALLAGCAAIVERPPPERLSEAEAARLGVRLPRPVTIDEIIAARRVGESEERLLARVLESGWDYRLGPDEQRRLRDAGVSERFIERMTARQRQEEQRIAQARREALWHLHSGPPYSAFPPYPPYGPYFGPWRHGIHPYLWIW